MWQRELCDLIGAIAQMDLPLWIFPLQPVTSFHPPTWCDVYFPPVHLFSCHTRKTPVPFTATFQQCPQPLAQEMAMTSSTPLFGSPTAQHRMGRRKAVRAKMMWSTPQWTFPFSLLLMPGKYVLTVGALFGKLVCTAWWECAAWGTYWADVLYSHHTVPVMGT